MKDKLRELAERWSNRDYSETDHLQGYAQGIRQASNELLAILDAEGDGGAVVEDMFDTASRVRDYLNRELPAENKHIFGEVLAALTYAQTHPARSGVVSDEDVRDAAVAYSKRATDGSRDVNFHDCIRAALEHFAKGEHHEL